ncbi:hypothetical protein pb186bvf_008261 [Paramecium bursaria]
MKLKKKYNRYEIYYILMKMIKVDENHQNDQKQRNRNEFINHPYPIMKVRIMKYLPLIQYFSSSQSKGNLLRYIKPHNQYSSEMKQFDIKWDNLIKQEQIQINYHKIIENKSTIRLKQKIALKGFQFTYDQYENNYDLYQSIIFLVRQEENIRCVHTDFLLKRLAIMMIFQNLLNLYLIQIWLLK